LADRNTLAVATLRANHPAEGSLVLDGELRLEDAISLSVSSRLERWPVATAESEALTSRFTGTANAEGKLDDLELRLRGTLSRADQQLPVELDAKLLEDALAIERLLAAGPAGRLQGTGRLEFAPALALTLELEGEQFDPGWLDPALTGSLGLKANLAARQLGEDWHAELQLERLDGSLQHAEISGSGRLAWDGAALAGELALELGGGGMVVSGQGSTAVLALRQLPLDVVLAGVGGRANGDVTLAGLPDALSWEADLQVEALRYESLRVESLRVVGGLGETGSRSLTVEWQDAAYPPQLAAFSGTLEVQGSLADYRAQLDASGEDLGLQAAWAGRLGDAPQLRVERLRLDSGRFGDWRLEQAGLVELAPRLKLAPLCLVSEGAQMCVESSELDTGEGLQLDLRELPLARVAALASAPENLRSDGMLTTRVRVRTAPSLELLDAEGQLEAGRVVDHALEKPLTLLEWQSVNWTLRGADAGRLRLDLSSQLLPDGQISLQLYVDAGAPQDTTLWDGELRVDIDQLQALALLAPDITAAQGAVRGMLRWQPGQPPQGELALQDFQARIAALGIEVRDSRLSLRQDDGGLQVDGVLNTGEGPLRVEGVIQTGPKPQARIRVAGTGVLLADTRKLALRASPDLQIGWQDGVLKLRGEVQIPQALIDLERLEAGVQASPDVVVMDPGETPRGAAALSLDADIKVALGESVKLAGFGFDGQITGTLALREQPGRAMRGRGTLDLSGSYRAYGQELEIERGRLLFASSALDNPGIDLRARRPLREVEVGVEVRGPARQPRLSLWSRPSMDQAEALSWLVLGQPLESATEADGAQLGQAAAAVGGNLLAARVGGRLGFDTFGVADSEALGGAAFTVGKYLSPKLYLSYGVGLFEEGRVVTLRYLINRQFDIELESAKESRAGINYRIETD
jgi:translocation and assembly module TamB